MNVINRKMYRSIVARVSGRPQTLDIGYGNGFLISKLYRKTGAQIQGIDISADMLQAATKRNRKAVERGDVRLGIGDCCTLAFDDQSFDVVTTVNTIYFWPDTGKGLTEIHRVLKEQGVFYNAVYTKRWLERLSYTKEGFRMFEKEDYLRMAGAAGFSSVEIVDIVAGTNFLVICKK